MTTEQPIPPRSERSSWALGLLNFVISAVLIYQVVLSGLLIWTALHGTLKIDVDLSTGGPLSVLAALVYQASMLVGLSVMLTLIRDVRRGRPFSTYHPGRLRLVAWGFLTYAFLAWLSPLFHVLPGGAFSIGGTLKFKWAPELLISLCLFALAEVFRHGLALRQDTDLTV